MKEWVLQPGIGFSFSSDATLLGGGIAFNVPATILRCRCPFISGQLDATMQVGDETDVSFGLAIISQDAFNAGAGSVPDPATDLEYPWLYWTSFHLHSQLATGVNAWGTSAQIIREIDTKAMRKVKPGQQLAWIAEVSNSAGAPVTNVDIGRTRVLIGT